MISNSFLGSKLALYVKNTSTGQKLKKIYLHQQHLFAVGDWRYPFFVLQWKLANLLTRRRKVKTSNGVEFTLPCRNWITHFRWYLFEKKEPEVKMYIDKYIKDGDVFFDIGANEGIFSVYAACKNKQLQVYCFEPEYSNLALLKENILENNLSERVNIFSVGVSDFNGLSQLHIQDTSEGAAAHSESLEKIDTTDEGYKVVWKEGIGVTTLDQFCERMNVVPNGIKIDTDGNEVKILKGARETLKNPKLKNLVIENPHDQGTKGIECEKILIENNFKKVWSDRSKTINEIWERT